MSFFKNKYERDLDIRIERIQMNMSNNYKDAAQINLKELEQALQSYAEEEKVKGKSLCYYEEQVGIYKERLKGFTHKDQKPYWTYITMIKEIQPNELNECVKVIRESFKTVADELGFTEENAPRFTAFATTEERLEWHLNGEKRPMYAYYENGTIVGYYSLLMQENKECELNNVCVLPTHRHKGIGEELLRHAFHVAEKLNCKKINIGIVEENVVLRKWYESFGFIHTGTQKFDFFPFTCGYMEKEL